MEVVKEFLRLRREKEHAEAAEMLTEGATLGTVWGYQHGKAKYLKYLADEPRFAHRKYLHDDVITKIDDNTYTRYFGFNRGMSEYPLFKIPQYREIFFLKDDKIRLVSCSRQNLDPGYFSRCFGM